jgi:hypothetical protein
MKTSLVFLLMALLVGAQLQRSALFLKSAQAVVRAEAHADVTSLQADGRSVGYGVYVAPSWMKGQWQQTRADLKELGADAKADARQGSWTLGRFARRISPSAVKGEDHPASQLPQH